jgi:hypothetical protein
MKIIYDYSFSDHLRKYFDLNKSLYVKYDIDVSSTPMSIAVIPFLVNVLPISWFTGFDIYIDELDQTFYNSASLLKEEFVKLYKDKIRPSKLVVKNITTNKIEGNKSLMLFSGGIDAYATFIRNNNDHLDLVTVLGADIPVDDKKQWEDVVDYNNKADVLRDKKKYYIESNIRDFYTYHVDLLYFMMWWGKVQHGMSLIGLLAPLSYTSKIDKLYIASSYTEIVDIAWGSMPQIDEKTRWADIQVVHDGYELKRQDKVDLITEYFENNQIKTPLRVCYSEVNKKLNCARCEKCYRSIIGIILSGKDPKNYGFNLSTNVYYDIVKMFEERHFSKGVQYFWWELMVKAQNNDTFFVLDNYEKEKVFFKEFSEGLIDELILKNMKKGSIVKKMKFIIRKKFPNSYELYKRIRY